MTRSGRRTRPLLLLWAVCAFAAGWPAAARAALNAGGVAYISWSRPAPPGVGQLDTTSVRAIPAAGDTLTLYLRLGLVQEIKGYEFSVRWSSTQTPACFSVAAVKEGAGTAGSEWIPRGTLIPVGPLVASDSILLASAFTDVGFATQGIVAAVTFRFPACTALDPASFCLARAYVIDSQNAVDTLTIVSDAFLGGGSPIRACGPPPPPRVDQIDRPSAFFGETVTMRISGFNFLPTPTVTLEREGTTVHPTAFTYDNASTMHATFDLAGSPFGNYVLVVRNPDGRTAPTTPSFVIKVPQARIDSLTPRVFFSGPAPGRATRMTIHGDNFYVNGSQPTVRLENGRTTLAGTQPTVESVNRLSATFTVSDDLSQLGSPIETDHLFVLVVQNADSPLAVYNGAAYLFRPPPSIASVEVTPGLDSNYVEWEISGATAGSRFRVVRTSLRCGVVTQVKTVHDSLYTRGTRFHFTDTKPEDGRAHVYTVTQVYLLGNFDSVTTTVAGADTVGVRCPDAETPAGVQFLSSVIRPRTVPLHVVFALDEPQRVLAQVFDTHGRLVRTLEDATRTGDVDIKWTGADAAHDVARPGVYTVQVTVGAETVRRKVVVVP